MLNRTDFILMTVLTALLVVGIPVALVFIDIHILVKIAWALMAVSAVTFWSHAFVKYRSGMKDNKKPIKVNASDKDGFFFGGLTFVATMVALLGIGSFEYESLPWEMLAVLITQLGIMIPGMFWYYNSKIKE